MPFPTQPWSELVPASRLVRQPTTDVTSLDRVDATSVGRLLAASGTSDIADAHVVICARRAGECRRHGPDPSSGDFGHYPDGTPDRC